MGAQSLYDLVIDECVQMAASGQENNIEMALIPGSSIVMLEALE